MYKEWLRLGNIRWILLKQLTGPKLLESRFISAHSLFKCGLLIEKVFPILH